MKPGDLVSMANRCGGPPGRTKCETALVVDVELKHQMVQVDSHEYRDREIYECTLMCRCGTFIEYDDSLEMIHETR